MSRAADYALLREAGSYDRPPFDPATVSQDLQDDTEALLGSFIAELATSAEVAHRMTGDPAAAAL